MTGCNLFLDLAERQTVAPVKARLRASDRRRSEREQKRDAEQENLSDRAQRQKELADARGGPDGAKIDALIARLDTLTIETIPALTSFVRTQDWRAVATDTLFIVRRLAAERIVRLREKRNLPPFDDSLPGEPAAPEEELRALFAENQTGEINEKI